MKLFRIKPASEGNVGYARPVVFFFLNLPFGISYGVLTILLPFLLTRAGISVATTASVIAIAVTPNFARALVAPVVDVTLSLKGWCSVSLGVCLGTLILLGLVPIRQDTILFVTAAAFLSQVGANLLAIPIGGLM